MDVFALAAAGLAALAIMALAVKAYVVVGQVGNSVQSMETEFTATARELAAAARGVQQSVGKLDGGLEALSSTLKRLDRLTEHFEPEVITGTVVLPAIHKLSAWLAGLRRGIGARS